MSASSAGWVVLCVLLGQVAAPPASEDELLEIRAAVARLGSEDFAEREAASRYLWKRGLAAEAWLRRATASPQGEIRARARAILRDFDHGIVPGEAARTIDLLKQYRDGPKLARGRVFFELLTDARPELIEKLIRQESQPVQRRMLLMLYVQHPRNVEQYLTWQAVEALIQRHGADFDDAARKQLVIQMLFATPRVDYLARSQRLDMLVQEIERETVPEQRRPMLLFLLGNPNNIQVIATRKQLGFLYSVIQLEADKKLRGTLLTQVCASPQFAEQVATAEQLPRLLAFVDQHLDANTRPVVLAQMLQQPAVVNKMLADGGVEGILKVARRVPDAAQRGQVLAALLQSPSVHKYLLEHRQLDFLLKLAREETDPAARRVYLQVLIQSPLSLRGNPALDFKSVWNLVKQDTDPAWRAGTMVNLLVQLNRAAELLLDPAEADVVVKLLSEPSLSPDQRTQLRQLVFAASPTLIDQGHLETLLAIANTEPDATRGELLAGLLLNANNAKKLTPERRLDLLLQAAQTESQPGVRRVFLLLVFLNKANMSLLVSAGYHDALWKLIQDDPDAAGRATLLGVYLQGSDVLPHILRDKPESTLLELAEGFDGAARTTYLTALFQNALALRTLLDKGHYEQLHKLALEDQAENLGLLLSIPSVMQRLVKEKQIATLLHDARQVKDVNVRRQFLQELFRNQPVVEAIVSEGHLDGFLEVIRAEAEPYQRGSLFTMLLRQSPVWKSILEPRGAAGLISVIDSEKSDETRFQLANELFVHREVLDAVIAQGSFDVLLQWIQRQEASSYRSSLLGRFVTAPKSLEYLAGQKRLELLLALTKSEQPDDVASATYTTYLFASTPAVTRLIQEGYYEDLWKLAQRDPPRRATWLNQLFNSPAAVEQLLARKQVRSFFDLIRNEKDPQLRANLLAALTFNSRLIAALQSEGLLPDWIALCRDEPDPTRHRALLGALLLSPEIIQRLAGDKQLMPVVDEALRGLDDNEKQSLLSRLISNQRVLTQLVTHGYFDRLLKATEELPRSSLHGQLLNGLLQTDESLDALDKAGRLDAVLQSILAAADSDRDPFTINRMLLNPRVVRRLVDTKQVKLLLERPRKLADANARRDFVQQLSYNDPALLALISAGEFPAWLALVRAEPNVGQRGQLVTSAIRRSSVLRELAQREQLPTLLKFIAEEKSVTSRELMLNQAIMPPECQRLLIEHKQFDAALELIQQGLKNAPRGQMLARFVTSELALSFLHAEGRLKLLVELAQPNPPDNDAAAAYRDALLVHTSAVSRLIQAGEYDALFQLARTGDDVAAQASRVARLIGTPAVVDEMVKRGQLRLLLDLLPALPPDARSKQLLSFTANERLLAALLEQQLFDALFAHSQAEADESLRGQYYCGLLTSVPAIQRLAEQKQLDEVVRLALPDPESDARKALLARWNSQTTAIRELAQRGYLQTLGDAARTSADSGFRYALSAALLRDAETFQQLAKSDLVNPLVQEAAQAPDAARTLYGSPLLARHVVEHLVATKQVGLLLESARNSKDENSRRSYLQSLLQNNVAMQALTAGDEFPALLALLKSDSDPQWQGILQGLLMRSPLALRALLAQDDSTFSLEQLFAQANAASRQQLFNYMLSSPDSIGLLIERGQFEVLTRLITQYFHGADRGSFIGRLLTSPKSLDHLAASKRLNLLLETAQPQPADAEFSQAYLSVLLGDRSAVSRLIEQEQYEALFTLANGTDDSAARAVRLSRLFSVPPAVEQMLARKQVHQVFDLVRADQPAEARRAYLTQFAGNEPMLNVLIDASLFEEFAGFCRGEPDSRARLQCYGGLLSSARAIEQLAAAKQLDAVWAEVTAGPDDNDRRNAFYQLLSRRPALTALVAQGKFDALLALSKTIGDANGTEQLANALVNDPAVVVTLLEKVGIEATLRQFYGSPTDAQRQRFVQRLVSNEATRRATLRAGRLDELLAVARTLPETTRQSIIATLLRGADTIDEFAQAGKLPVLWELLDREADSAPQLRMQFLQSLLWQPEGKRLLEEYDLAEQVLKLLAAVDEPDRDNLAGTLLNDSQIRAAWVAHGQSHLLRKLIEQDDPAQRPRWLHDLQYSPSGLLGHFVLSGKLDEAEMLLEQAEGDYGTSLWLSFMHTQDRLDACVATARTKFDAEADAAVGRRLALVLRAQGDLPAAREVARKIGDENLLRALTVEARDWPAAAAVTPESVKLPPLHLSSQSASAEDLHTRIEQLGTVAAYQRLARQDDDCDRTIGQLLDIAANSTDTTVQWLCAEALLLNQRYDDGLRLARASQPQRAFKLHCFRGEYDEALTLIGWRGEGELDAAWIDSLPLDARTPDSLQSRNRFTFALEVAEVLRKLGRAADVERLLAAVEAYIAAVPERRGTSVADAPPLRNHYVQRYCGALYRGGMTDRAWDVFGPNNTSSLDPYLHPPSWFVTEAFGTRGAEVQVWWRHFSQSRDGRSPRDLAAQVAAVLVPKSQADVECFPALAANAIAKLQAENMTFDSHWRALGDTCRAYGQQELALRCYDRANELSGPSDDAAARALYRAQRWPEAAQRYEQVWRSNRDAIGAWYLSGEALFRAGEEDAGTLRKRQALLMAAAPRVRWQLGVYLQEHGLSETPVKRWEELLRLAPLESWETIDAAWRLSADGLDHDPARAADLWEQHTLYDFRVDSAFRNVEAYLRTPFIIHRQRASAALAAQDWEGLSREADLAMRAVPSDTTLAEELVPALIAQGRTAEADTVFDRAWQAAAKLVAAYPNSAEFKNHQAWLAARCDKRLDEALALAEKSVALDPNKSYNLDTLAEVHFRLGHREDAVKFGTLALDFRPLSESLRQQLKRFQEAPDRN